MQWFTPLVAEAARPSRHAVGGRWQVDETYELAVDAPVNQRVAVAFDELAAAI